MSSSHETKGHSTWTREKLDRDLDDPLVRAEVGAEQAAYYRQRAPWFDDIYACRGDYDGGPELNRLWRDDMALIDAALAHAPLRGDCVDLGAGTGYWTERFVERVDRLWVLDSAPEALAIARDRLGRDRLDVSYEVVDLWSWEPDGSFDCAVACYFLEHVPDVVLPLLLATLHGALRPGGCVFAAEAAFWVSEPSVETRSIDERTYQVVERRRTADEFEGAFAAAGFSAEVGGTDRVVWLTATKV